MDYPIRANSMSRQVLRRPRCPVCEGTRVECVRSVKQGPVRIRYYRCHECLDLHTRKPTTFQVTVV